MEEIGEVVLIVEETKEDNIGEVENVESEQS